MGDGDGGEEPGQGQDLEEMMRQMGGLGGAGAQAGGLGAAEMGDMTKKPTRGQPSTTSTSRRRRMRTTCPTSSSSTCKRASRWLGFPMCMNCYLLYICNSLLLTSLEPWWLINASKTPK